MATDIRTVVDTNIVVSAVLLPRSVPRQAFELAAAIGSVLLSEATLAELDEVLRRPKFDAYVSEPKRLEFLLRLVETAEIVPVTLQISSSRDPKDNKFLELAVAGRATHIMSGDADLLSLNPFQQITIISAQEFLNHFSELA
jgi:putative PIN family toxin of toxin-antitoxin system